jgi:hypothetical protein
MFSVAFFRGAFNEKVWFVRFARSAVGSHDVSAPAYAATVSAYFYLGASSVPAPLFTNASEIEDYLGPGNVATNSPPPTIPANFIEGALDLSTISVTNTQITISSLSTLPFCTTFSGTDIFTGFAFHFSSGVNITGVTMDPASAPDFFPNTVTCGDPVADAHRHYRRCDGRHNSAKRPAHS